MIPVNEPLLTDRDLELITDCVRSGWVSSAGQYLTRFEEEWANYCGRKFGVAVCNGTAALELAVQCLNLGPGDEVILPTCTIISCAFAVVRAGATPVLVDVDPRTWCLDVNQVAERLTPRTRAILPVHLYGHPTEMDPLLELAAKHGLAVIEDAAEAHGAEYQTRLGGEPRWRRCGAFGDLSCFSFYANKLITTGEGGMILTDDPRLAAKARAARNLCFQPQRRFYHEELSGNYRMTNLQAALGVAQLERIGDIVARKRRLGWEYTRRLGDLPALQLPVEEPWARNVWWMYGLVVAEATGMDAVQFAQRLAAKDVETRPFFLGMHEQPVFHRRGLFAGERYPVAERLARQGLYLPSGLALSDEQREHVCQAVREVLA
jgi:perosamine synthetase